MLVDGVKVLHDDGWALVLPDPEEPLTHVWAEAATDAEARGLAPRSTPCASASCCADRGVRIGDGVRSASGGCAVADQVSSARMNVPDDLRYSTDHEWARADGDRVRVGITDYAQDALGDVVYVELPPRAPRWRRAACSARSSRPSRCRDIYAPVAGTVVEVNADAGRRPRAPQRGPVRRGLDLRDRPVRRVGGRRAARRRRLPAVDRRLTVIGGRTTSRADGGSGYRGRRVLHQCGHRNPTGVELLLVVRRRRWRPRHPTRRSSVDPVEDLGEAGDDESPCRPARAAPRGGAAGGQAGPDVGSRFALEAPITRPAPPRQRHLPRRHHRVPAPRRDRDQGPDGTTVRDVGSLNGTYLNRERIEEARLSNGDELQIGKFKLVFSWPAANDAGHRRGPATGGHERPLVPVDRRGADPPPGGVPRHHHLQDPVPREPGPARPRAHAVGLPQVLRARRRAAALDPAPAAGELPAPQGDQGPPG